MKDNDIIAEVFEVFSAFPEYEHLLNEALKYFLINNCSNTLPYHNAHHTAVKIIESYKIGKTYNDLKTFDFIALILSDIFHDFNHSGGALPDTVNIEIAKTSFIKFIYWVFSNKYKNEIFFLDFFTLKNEVLSIIDATEFPYTSTDLTINQKISRDSDMGVLLYDSSFQSTILGLYTELKTKPSNKSLTLIMHVSSQVKFLNWLKDKKFYSDYYNERFINSGLIDSKLETLDQLLYMLADPL